MTVLFSSVFSGIAMLWDRQFGFLKETLVAPGLAPADHGRPHPRRRDRRHHSGHADPRHLPHRRLPARVVDGDSRRLPLRHPDRHRLRRARHRHRLRLAGHAGLPARHELPCAAHLLSLGRALSAHQPAHSHGSHRPHRPAHLRRRRPARRAHRRTWQFSAVLDIAVLAAIACVFLGSGAYLFSKIEA